MPDTPADLPARRMPEALPKFRVEMAANVGGFEIARLKCSRFLVQHGVNANTVAVVELVLEECITNTLQYGYGQTGLRWIALQLVLQADAVEVVIEDDAHGFDPSSAAEPELPRSLEEARVGGLGLLMVRRSVESWRYSRSEGLNRLTARIALRD